MKNYDLIIIGSGPAGYVGAVYASQMGLKVAMIEKESWLGGTCLNIGCIPTKAMLHSALMFDKAKKLPSYGVRIGKEEDITLDFDQVNKRKDEIVTQVNGGVDYLMKKNKVDVIRGVGKILNKSSVEVTDSSGKKENYGTKFILVATGSRVRHLPHIKVDKKNILTSDELLFIKKVPKSLVIVGGGVIGCEFASVFGRFGTQVTIVELGAQIVPTEDLDSSRELEKALKKQNCEILKKTKVTSLVSKGNGVELSIEGQKEPLRFEKALLSIGRAPNVEGIGLENVGIGLDKRGFVPVDLNSYKTSVSNIYAVGDVLATAQLAHTASAEAMFAIDDMTGKKRRPINYKTNPAAIYTYPEVASIGETEQTLKSNGVSYKASKFPFTAIAKARIDDASEGFVKILVDTKYGEVLGVHIVHAKASEMISEFSLGNNLEMTIAELGHTIHPHPTLSEAFMEVAHMAEGHPINI
jgi:dihydrolipoamide dehydrogenase